jgi:superfamily II DNA or RNA helicase
MIDAFDGIPRALLALRRSQNIERAADTGPIRFQLRFGENGAQLLAVTEKGKPLSPDHRGHTGLTREILKAMASDQQTLSEQFDWGNTEASEAEAIALTKQYSLVSLLARSGALVDAEMEPIETIPGTHHLRFHLGAKDGEGNRFSTALHLRDPGGKSIPLTKPQMITDGYLADGKRLFAFESVGPHHAMIPLFLEEVPAQHLETFLTLMVSALPSVGLSIDSHTVEEGEPVTARPALIFNEVDPNGALDFSTGLAIAHFPIEFTRDYDISRVALVDAGRRAVRLRPVVFEEAHAALARLFKSLAGLERKQRSAENFLAQCDDRWLLSADLARDFLTTELPVLAATFALFGTGRLRNYRIVHAKPKLNLRLSHGIQFLDGEGDLEIEGERISLLDALAQYRKNNYITLSDGNQAVVDPDYMARLERLVQKNKKGVRVSFFDLPLLEDLMGEAAAAADLPKAREVFAGFNRIQERRPALSRFRGDLRPYQVAGLQWLDYLRANQLGGCLADDMGLGKTVQAIALLAELAHAADAPTLIVMPRSLLFNWARELETFAPHLDHTTHYGPGRDWETAQKHGVVLTTYGTLRADIETMVETPFRAVILDESQAIKNPTTQTARAAFALRADFRLALSGTPVENHLGELYALFRFLNPGMFGSAVDFERHYATPIQKNNDPQATADLRRKIYPFVLRRLKADVLKELPPKVEQILWVEMNDAQKQHYERRRLHYKRMVDTEVEERGLAAAQFMILEAMLELRQIATVPESRVEDGSIVSSKRERLMEAIQEALENGRKCLVFSNFLAGVEQVCQALNEEGIEYERMTGATANRQERVERFQNDPRVKVFVMTLKTGGVGLNLTAADTVFILDPWWNTSAESQAVDRAHRIGQMQTVFTYRLIARGTIEEKILQLQQKKKELVDQIVSSDGGALKSLSEADIDHLFDA